MNRWTTKTMWMTVFPTLFFPPLAQAQVVTSLADSGAGSLRQVVADAASNATITFDASLNGETIVLFEQIVLDKDLVIDAEALPRGVGISGNSNGNRELEPGETRIFLVQPGRDVRLRALTLRDGQVDPKPGTPGDTAGGAILNWGSLLMERCLIVGGSARIGGGIYNAGDAKLTLVQTTITGNHASESGGAIFNTGNALVTLEESTLSANLADNSGGGVWTDGGGVDLLRTILAGNQAPSGENEAGGLQSVSQSFVGGDPGLLPLADHGGPVETLMPRSGSPVLDAAGTSTSVTDARGQPRNTDGTGNGIAQADIGAVEFNPVFVQNLNASGPGSLREVVEGSVGDAVMFLLSLNGGTIVLDGEEILLNQDMIIDAMSLPNRITISGNSNGNGVLDPGESRIFLTSPNTHITLRGLHLTGGQTDVGAIGTATIGGAMHVNGTLVLENCLFTHNTAREGGALSINSGGDLIIRQSTFTANVATDNGGALRVFSQNTEILQSTLSGNSAGGFGGALFGTTTLVANNNVLAGNSSANGSSIGGNSPPVGNNNILSGDPRLAPLGFYNRPVMSMPPLPGSPAVDAGGPTPFVTDMAGMPRALDGNGNGVSVPDIGAAEMYPSVVSQTGLTGFGSLPEVMEFFSDVESGTITFASALSGETILLDGSPIVLNQDLTLDGSMLAEPLTLSGGSNNNGILEPGESRVLEVPAGVTATLRGLRLANGQVDMNATTLAGRGGLVLNQGNLTLERCELTAGQAYHGGGIANHGDGELTLLNSIVSSCDAAGLGGGIFHEGVLLTLTNSTLHDNKAVSGGGLANTRGGFLTQVTFYNNVVSEHGGAIYNENTEVLITANLTLDHCTITGNEAAGSSGGGGILIDSGTIAMLSSIVAGNTAAKDPNISGSLSSDVNNLTSGDPQLMPFGNYGGPTPTLPPDVGSPALGNAFAPSLQITDQRGWPRVFGSGPDIGAVERWPTGYYLWISSFFPGETDLATIGPEASPAEDGVANVMKFAFGIPPMADSSAAHPRAALSGAGAFGLEFERSLSNFVLYSLEATDDLMEEFLPAGAFQVETTPLGNGREVARFFLNAPPGPHLFLRLKVELPE